MDRRVMLAVAVVLVAALVWILATRPDDDGWTPEDREAVTPEVEDPGLRDAKAPADPTLEGSAPPPGAEPAAEPEEPDVVKAPAHSGTFAVSYKQGYSFLERRVVAKDEGKDAHDIQLSHVAGGISSTNFVVPGGGIAGAYGLQSALGNPKTTAPVFVALLRADTATLKLGRDGRGDSRTAASDVFIAKTKRGEWVKLAILHRDKTPRGWQNFKVHVAYELNPKEPVFASGEGDVRQQGFVFDTQRMTDASHPLLVKIAEETAERERAAQEKERPFREAMEALDARVVELQGAVTTDGHHVAAVMAQQAAKALGSRDTYRASTYSFEKKTRDDTEATRNDWDFVVYDQGDHAFIRVRTVTDDRGFIWDLGVIGFEQALRGDVQFVEGVEGLQARVGHLYLIHTLDSETDYWVLMKVLESEGGETLLFEWRTVDDPTALRRALEPAEKNLAEPFARLQMLSDHGGGNPHRAFLDGSKNAYVDKLVDAPIDLSKPATDRSQGRRSRAFVLGGYVPEGKVFRVESVEVTIHLDKPSRVDTAVRVGPFTVLSIENLRRRDAKEGQLELLSADRGVEIITPADLPIRRTMRVDIPIHRDEEKTVFVEGASYTRNDVVLRGRFEDAPKKAWVLKNWKDRQRRSAEWMLKGFLQQEDTDAQRLQFVRNFHNLEHGEVWLARVRDHLSDMGLKQRLGAVLEMLR